MEVGIICSRDTDLAYSLRVATPDSVESSNDSKIDHPHGQIRTLPPFAPFRTIDRETRRKEGRYQWVLCEVEQASRYAVMLCQCKRVQDFVLGPTILPISVAEDVTGVLLQ